MLEHKIAQLEERLLNARVIDTNDVDTSVVSVGSVVRLRDVDAKETVEYHIVGSAEANPAERRLSNESPVGRAILGRKKGETVEVLTPRGQQDQVQDHGDQGSLTRRCAAVRLQPDARGSAAESRCRAPPHHAKRFPDRDEIAAVREECEPLEAGQAAETSRRIAGRAMARRDMGKLVFLDVVDRTGRIQVICEAAKTGEIDVLLGDVVGVSGHPGARAPRRAVAARRDGRGALAQHAAAAGHVPRAHGRRAPLPQALPRPARQRGDASRLRPAGAHRLRRARLPRRRGLRRGRDAGAAAALRRRLRAPVRDAPQRARARPLPPDRDRALPEAADRRRARARLRARQGLPQRGRLVQAQPRVHDARVVRGVRRLPRHDGAHRDARRDGRAARCSARRRCGSAATSSS